MTETFDTQSNVQQEEQPISQRPRRRGIQAWDLLLILILAAAAYLRFVGLDWDQDQHLHPDERFLTMVETSISPVDSPGEYFNTAESSLNPNNRGYTFYVYGTLPLFIVRYLGEWVGKTGYGEIYLVGRAFSAVSDLLTIFLVYLTADHLYRKKAISLLAAAFSAYSVLQIQLSHYGTVDVFANLCSMAAFFVAVRILKSTRAVDYTRLADLETDPPEKVITAIATRWGTITPYVLFGVAFGMALASKISSAPLAILLPGAVLINYVRFTPGERRRSWIFLARNMVVAALVTILVFRIFQPYAFKGPGFLGMIPNQGWIQSLSELSAQSSGEVDFPPALQWARRPIT
ncbi:MAG: glycosyltransferase family 39 protein, partial [Anaerolineaceae bacterium]